MSPSIEPFPATEDIINQTRSLRRRDDDENHPMTDDIFKEGLLPAQDLHAHGNQAPGSWTQQIPTLMSISRRAMRSMEMISQSSLLTWIKRHRHFTLLLPNWTALSKLLCDGRRIQMV